MNIKKYSCVYNEEPVSQCTVSTTKKRQVRIYYTNKLVFMGLSDQTHLNSSYLSNISPLSSAISSRFSWPKVLLSMKINWRIQTFRFDGVLAITDIEIFEFTFCLPPPKAYKAAANACSNLAPENGDAEMDAPSRFHTKRTRITPIS
jgi:hypothetical protein